MKERPPWDVGLDIIGPLRGDDMPHEDHPTAALEMRSAQPTLEYEITVTVSSRVRCKSITDAVTRVGDDIRSSFEPDTVAIEHMDIRRIS